jgi:hypothetical protein
LDCTETPCAGTEAGTVMPIKPPPAPIVKPRSELHPRRAPKPCLDAAKWTRPPPRVQQALAAVPKAHAVSFARLWRHRLRLPYGRWITADRAAVLYNRKYQPIFIWRAGAERPERCDPYWVNDIASEGWFFSDGSAGRLGRTALFHALEALLAAWERGDRAAADAVGTWLLDKHLVYLKLARRR